MIKFLFQQRLSLSSYVGIGPGCWIRIVGSESRAPSAGKTSRHPLYRTSSPIVVYFAWLILIIAAGTCEGQVPVDAWLKQSRSAETAIERATALRALSTSVQQRSVSPEQQAAVLKAVESAVADDDPVMRLAGCIELLKLASFLNDEAAGKRALGGLTDSNINVRRGTIKFARSWFERHQEFGKQYETLIEQQLESKDLETRYHAATTLAQWNRMTEPMIGVLLESLDLQNYRAATVYFLVNAREQRKTIIARLTEHLEMSAHNSGVIINLLSLLTPESNAVADRLLPKYESKDVAVRAAVVDAVARMEVNRESALALIDRALGDESPLIRRLALTTLIQLEPGNDVFKEAIFRLLSDRDGNVAMAATDKFGLFGDQFAELVPDLKPLLNSDDPAAIVTVLNGLMTAGPMARPAAPEIIRLLSHENRDVRVRAVWALHEVKADPLESAEALNRLLESEQDVEVVTNALSTLSLLAPGDDSSRATFMKFLDDDNEFNRLSSAIGLRRFPSPEVANRLLRLKNGESAPPTGRGTQLDQEIVETLVAGQTQTKSSVVAALGDDNSMVRARALEACARMSGCAEENRSGVLEGLSAESDEVRLAAAAAVVQLESVDPETVDSIFELVDVNNRQRTTQVLQLLAKMGKNAAPVTPRIAELLTGKYRSRFGGDARRTLLELGEHAAPALPKLLEQKFTLPTLDCIAAIGSGAKAAAPKLKLFVETQSEKIANERSTPAKTNMRRRRLAAAVAHWMVSGDKELAARFIREELDADLRPLALLAAQRLVAVDPELLDRIVAFLPDRDAINSLADIGAAATAVVDELRPLMKHGDPELAFLAKKAVWQITDDPEIAIGHAKKLLHDNRHQPVEIRTAQRQQMWQSLRFLGEHETGKPEISAFLDRVQNGRFPNLREFVAQLRADRPQMNTEPEKK